MSVSQALKVGNRLLHIYLREEHKVHTYSKSFLGITGIQIDKGF